MKSKKKNQNPKLSTLNSQLSTTPYETVSPQQRESSPGANSNKKSMTTEFAAVRMEIIKQGGERNFLGTFRSLCLLSITTRAIEVLSGTAATSASGILWIVAKTGPISLGLAFLLWVILRALV